MRRYVCNAVCISSKGFTHTQPHIVWRCQVLVVACVCVLVAGINAHSSMHGKKVKETLLHLFAAFIFKTLGLMALLCVLRTCCHIYTNTYACICIYVLISHIFPCNAVMCAYKLGFSSPLTTACMFLALVRWQVNRVGAAGWRCRHLCVYIYLLHVAA